MAATYSKPALTFNEQVTLLRSRGMDVPDEEAARRVLTAVSYYRLSAYAYPFREHDDRDSFEPGTTFERIVQLYEFDRRLRLVLLDAIERVEVAVRTRITYEFAHRHGPFGHHDPANFEAWFRHDDWLSRLDKEVEQSKETFVQHYRRKYDGFPRVPLWMATEVMSFGALTLLFKGCQHDLRAEIATVFGCHESVLATWLLCASYVRNLCAHHCRVWNRDLALAPKLPKRDARWRSPIMARGDRAYTVLLLLRSATRSLDVDGGWAASVGASLGADLSDPFIARGMGIHGDWKAHPVWSAL